MFLINNVLMRPDNISESVDLLEDSIIVDVTRPFPNIDSLPEGERVATTFAIASYIVDKTDIDYGQDGFRDTNRFEIITSLVSKALAKDLNEYAPIDMVMFASLFKALMAEKFKFLFKPKHKILSDVIYSESSDYLPLNYRKIILDNTNSVLSAYNKIENS